MCCRLLVLLLKDFGYFEDINVSGVSRIDLISDYNLALIRRLLFEIPLSNFRNFPRSVLASEALKQKQASQYAKVDRVEKKRRSTQQVGTTANRRQRKAAYEGSQSPPLPFPSELRRFDFTKLFFKPSKQSLNPKPLHRHFKAQTYGRQPHQDPEQR